MQGLLVSLVLFDGGLNLRLPGETIKATVQRIAALRLLISLGAGLLAAHWLAGSLVPRRCLQCHRHSHGANGGHSLGASDPLAASGGSPGGGRAGA